MISLAITVCNEHQELETLLNYLEDRALFPEYEIDVRRLFHFLENAGVRAEINNGAVAVADRDFSGAELNRLAQSAGVTLKLITSAQKTLETRFFELVANG